MKSVTTFTEYQPPNKHASIQNIGKIDFIKKKIKHHNTFE